MWDWCCSFRASEHVRFLQADRGLLEKLQVEVSFSTA